MELHFGAKQLKHDYEEKKLLSSTKESQISELLSKRAILAIFFFLSVAQRKCNLFL